MSLQLRADVHWCDCGGRAVFLDTVGDRYFCLPQLANDAFLRLAAGKPLAGDTAHLHSLLTSKMLIETSAPESIRQPPLIEKPTHDLIWCRSRRLLLAMVTLFLAEIRAARSLRKQPFHEVLAAAREESRAPWIARFAPAGSIEKIASAAAALSFITGRHDRCLVRALAVHSICKDSGSKAQLVFGVVAHPFTAHCWVQAGSGVVVGGYEHARLYTPVLVI